MERIRAEGVTLRVIPGILPITDLNNLEQFCDTCGTTIPSSISDIFEPLECLRGSTLLR
ncbi:MAG TPA: hypothetical protein ENI15_18420 [Spirochaetes bacterium]|nr:hypothetical protein [Spirochaetota bacterium]